MKGEGYKYIEDAEKTTFTFTSVGEEGAILKIVVFSPVKGDLWNLAFGDVVDDDFNDESVTNNQDVRIVIQTVANITHRFLEMYPQRKVLIDPVDEKRSSLYNLVFRHHWQELELVYEIIGRKSRSWKNYSPENTYDAFIVARK